MKKQWLSIVLVLCMVLCLAPTTARAEESKTGTLKITVNVQGLYGGVDAGGKTFSFEILRKYANYGHYKNVDITIDPGKTEGTVDVPVEEGKYIVKQTSYATISAPSSEHPLSQQPVPAARRRLSAARPAPGSVLPAAAGSLRPAAAGSLYSAAAARCRPRLLPVLRRQKQRREVLPELWRTPALTISLTAPAGGK